MKIAENLYKEYNKYQNFISEFIVSAMNNGSVFLIVNWEDALGVCQLLNTYTINGNAIAMKSDFADELYYDIEEVKEYAGNMIITLFDNGEMICEKTLEKSSAYVDDACYYIEYSAGEVTLPLHATVVPFKIINSIFSEVV